MIEVKYVNSKNESLSFFADKMIVSDGSFHKRKWTVSDDEITKDAVTYNLTLTLRGLLRERKQMLNKLCDLFEIDNYAEKQGKLYFGEYYIFCNISSSTTQINSVSSSRTDVVLEVYCKEQKWIKEEKYHLNKRTKSSYLSEDRNLEYEYDYPYDYYLNTDGSVNIKNNNISSCDFEMIIFGPCSQPRILVNDMPIQIFCDVLDREYIKIDSRSNTVYKYNLYGKEENIYDLRLKQSSIFSKIPSGNIHFIWSGGFSFDITLYKERSEPEWI